MDGVKKVPLPPQKFVKSQGVAPGFCTKGRTQARLKFCFSPALHYYTFLMDWTTSLLETDK